MGQEEQEDKISLNKVDWYPEHADADPKCKKCGGHGILDDGWYAPEFVACQCTRVKRYKCSSCISLLADLRSRLWARCENAYCDMISVADESLGREIKVERGEFGRKELDSHTKMGELLGRYRALAEACREIDDVLNTSARG